MAQSSLFKRAARPGTDNEQGAMRQASPSRYATAAAHVPRTSDLGFTLVELIVVMTIIAILTLIAVPSYVRNVQRAKEAVLKEDLRVLRTAIDSYTVDKQQAPQSLDELVQAGYIREIPADPITNQKDWVPDTSGTLSSIDQTDSGGISDVHPGAQRKALDGSSYNTW